jgi:oligopeptide/dipeptide ABC transporter ATP-binding protein
MADRVMVMYAGTVVETAPVDNLYDSPRHPYTIKLLKALPRIGGGGPSRLESIERSPPDLLSPPVHCQFAWRCDHVQATCMQEIPGLRDISPAHQVACFYDING